MTSPSNHPWVRTSRVYTFLVILAALLIVIALTAGLALLLDEEPEDIHRPLTEREQARW